MDDQELFEETLKEVSPEVSEEPIKEEYKDSDKACFEKELGDPKEIVKVVDVDKDGKISVYTWEREKSNQNIIDTGTGKRGFSFYLARLVFFDEYFYLDSDLATNKNYTGIIGVIPGDKKQEELIVINTEDGPGTRIISAYYADDPKYTKFVEKYWIRRKMLRKKKENMPVLSEEKLLHLQKLTERWHSMDTNNELFERVLRESSQVTLKDDDSEEYQEMEYAADNYALDDHSREEIEGFLRDEFPGFTDESYFVASQSAVYKAEDDYNDYHDDDDDD